MAISDLAVGTSCDVHRFKAGIPLMLGGIHVPFDRGMDGHSDGDVLLHAIMDAVLSAADLPDLGTLYLASDEQYRDASSLDLLRDVMTRVNDAGWVAANVDVVIAAEHPRLAPHIAAMAENLTEVVGAPVSIKPKHAEGVGAIGRGEGIAAWAIALLVAQGNG